MSDLTTQTATSLAALLASGEVSSEEVTRAHLDRIEAVDGRIHAFTEVFRDEALAAARRADDERRAGQARGPIHGLPVSVKESLDMAGHTTTLGVPARKGTRATHDAGMVRALRDAGAVILGRTNVAQLLLYNESRNPIFGQTVNPWSAAHTPGGSSGGESAAIAAGMSPLGVGTDIGGSIRVPAHFTGITGLKPTLDRWTNKGQSTALVGQEAVRGQSGPMARSARDLSLLMTALDPRRMSAADPRVPPLPFEDPSRVDVGKLRIGFYIEDGLILPSAAVARAVMQAASALQGLGVSVVPFTPPGIEDAIYTYFAALSADAGETALGLLKPGDADVVLRSMKTLATLSGPLRRAAAGALGLAGEHRLRRLLEATGKKTVTEYWRITGALRDARAAILDAMDAASLDVLLCPPFATPALPHTYSKDFVLAGSASMLWNLAQFPAGVVPVTRVRPNEMLRDPPRDRLEKHAADIDRRSVGLPVGVQVVARPWAESLLLAVMIALEDALRADSEWPATPHVFP